ncbi:peptidase S1 and S6 chymotrypsin/Hap [Gloeothece citriformis PCC 7424]|uniref:Peptidase S1 and S6 chymotrypsin/Hap n=1 Tax=Gloeothece citriformis (strain PCC 7424) TaxID=65393 RepID=B7KAX3_GLOC7|nr:serine protease [Gloeothece citriformis]ACK70083.1 peptidase S1 and S6 chymotrypsin/Hap [Gloeothece citriformis PCC 7424]
MKVTLTKITEGFILLTLVNLSQIPSAVSLPIQEITKIAQEVTVKIDGVEPGTGVIVEQQNNIYTVLTNCHVVDTAGQYTIETYDGKSYPFEINTPKSNCHSEADLALVRFTSSLPYRVVQLWDSSRLKIGDKVYVSGWKSRGQYSQGQRRYRFADTQVIGLDRKATKGYSLAYNGFTNDDNPGLAAPEPGMSGGPILDAQGRLVAINGLFAQNPNIGVGEFLAVPINVYTTWQNIVLNIPEIPSRPTVIKPESSPNNCIRASGC